MNEFKVGDQVTLIGHFTTLVVNDVMKMHLQCYYYNQKSGSIESIEVNKNAVMLHTANTVNEDQKEVKPKSKKAVTGKNVRKNGY